MPRDRTSASRRVRLDRARTQRVWLEGALAAGALLLALLTVVVPDWIEAVFRVDPDAGNGALEWAIAAGFALVALTLALLARRTHATLARDVS